MREILFRGKATNREDGREYRTKYKNGDWVFGLLAVNENYAGFAEMTNTNGVCGIDVDRNTIGQYTGLTDKNGKKIFEGDIVKGNEEIFTEDIIFTVVFDEYCRYMIVSSYGHYLLARNHKDVEVIGNIHDNPELLKGGAAE